MVLIFTDGRWQVALNVVNALVKAGLVTDVDTEGRDGLYRVSVDMRQRYEAKRIIASLAVA